MTRHELHLGISEQRYFLRYEIENAITEIISKRIVFHRDAVELFTAWCEDEDGNLALDRLINLIIH